MVFITGIPLGYSIIDMQFITLLGDVYFIALINNVFHYVNNVIFSII